MIKRVGNMLIIILLLIATSGIPVTRHYCGPSEMSFSIYSSPKPCCDNHCSKCHNVFNFSKVNDAFEAGSSITFTQSVNNIVTLHALNFIELIDNTSISPLSDLIHNRNLRIAEADLSPASLGNFRC